MHRYWKYAFPEDFGYRAESEADAFHAHSLVVALDYADEQIGFLRQYVDERKGRLYIVSSMGQEAIDRGEHAGEIRIEDLERFVRGIGYAKPFQPRMAMHPNFTVALESSADTTEFVGIVRALLGAHGKPAFSGIDVEGNTVLFSIGCTPELIDGGALYTAEGSKLPFENIGIVNMMRDGGTGYHQPEGIVIRYGAGIAGADRRARMESIGHRAAHHGRSRPRPRREPRTLGTQLTASRRARAAGLKPSVALDFPVAWRRSRLRDASGRRNRSATRVPKRRRSR